MKAVIGDSSIQLEGLRYFVGKARSITFGSWGEKRSPVGPGQRDHLEARGVLPAPRLAKVRLSTTALAVEFQDETGIHVMAALSVPGLASGKVGLSAEDFASGRVRLIKVSPAGDAELIEQVNASPAMVDGLVGAGRSARVVVDVLIAVEAGLYGRFASGAADADALLVDDLMLRADREVGSDRGKEVHVGPGTVIGYSLAEPKWIASPDKRGAAVESLRMDEQEGQA